MGQAGPAGSCWRWRWRRLPAQLYPRLGLFWVLPPTAERGRPNENPIAHLIVSPTLRLAALPADQEG